MCRKGPGFLKWPLPWVLSKYNTEERLLEGITGHKGRRAPEETSGPVAANLATHQHCWGALKNNDVQILPPDSGVIGLEGVLGKGFFFFFNKLPA